MRIVHWAPQFGSETGTGKAIDGWLQAMSSRGLDCTVVSLPQTTTPAGYLSKVKVRSKPGIFQRLNLFGHEIKTANVVHLHGAFDLKLCAVHAIIALEKIWRMFTGEPLHIVMTPHGALSGHVFSTHVRRKLIYWNCVERLLAKQTSLAICTTPFEAMELRRLLPAMRVEVVPLVVSKSESTSAPMDSGGAPDTGHVPVLCTLGRYDIRTKGLDLLIHAVVKLNRGGFPVRLRCVGYDCNGGTGELEGFVKSVDAGEFVECVGPKFGEEKFRIIAGCDAFCMPSRYESFSYALMEGLGTGLPVLVGSGACLTSFFDDSQRQAMVVAPEASAWQAAIRELLDSPGAKDNNRRCAHRALEELTERCSANVVSDALGGLYHSIWMGVRTVGKGYERVPVASPAGTRIAPPSAFLPLSINSPSLDAPDHAFHDIAPEAPLETSMEGVLDPSGDQSLAPRHADFPANQRVGGPNLLPQVLGTPVGGLDAGPSRGRRLFH